LNNEEAFNKSINEAVKRYSSLFTLPSLKTIFLLISILCFSCGFLLTALLSFSWQSLVLGITFGAILFLSTLSSDLIVNYLLLNDDPVYEIRRCLGLSVFSLCFWLAFILLGNGIAFWLGDVSVWLKFWLFGFSAVIILRLIVLNATSISSSIRRIVAAILTPLITLFLLFLMWASLGNALSMGAWIYLALSIPISLVTVYIFTFSLDKIGKQKLGFPLFTLFKAFLINWIEDIVSPLEKLFKTLGTKKTVEISILKFKTQSTKAIIAIPQVHPGPFKNVGSSLLPSKLQEALEKKFKCIAAVPHGLLGHEFDVSSGDHVKRIIEKVVSTSEFPATSPLVSPLIQVTRDAATVLCQVFGDCAVISLTLAPKTTEDLPQELGVFALKEAKKHGLSHVIVINAHNSLNGTVPFQEAIESLKKAIAESLKKSATLKKRPFKVGAAKVIPSEFGLKEGMGPGGITAITIEVGNQTSAYVTIDANNMVSGLREKILSMFNDVGVDLGEVFTTDTHAVTAIVITRRGYHALGEVISQEKLIEYVRKAVEMALANMEPAKVGHKVETVSNVNVIGEKQITALCSLIEPSLKKAKRISLPLFSITGFLLALLLIWLF